ncbi:hypothetical protein F4821DRAFT_227493 [Hypoxylon rubiginosum]|uniref:Uncharacterized protein n=1 Tax=Hypoxylon rubiginosum TaxID=110542 RepID=A0ACC0DFI0_9PEZI|nr:hypothetical protein F4821DRAFT_227493 [Hypoxylon rubiginosum]
MESSAMPTLKEAHGPEEDWSGLKDAKARRKLQNRLNVRAHRRRKALLAETRASSEPSSNSNLQFPNGTYDTCGDQVWFPLTLDHLIPLVQYNFIRGVLTNMAILGSQNAFPKECARIWIGMPLFPAPSTVPESLQPTALQRSTPHEPWIDLIPDKQIRDNAILALGTFKREDVEEDVTVSVFGTKKLLELNGIIAWDEPWRPEGWEFTEGFIRRWPFLVKGCWKMLESTNRWRAVRGEEPLVIEL